MMTEWIQASRFDETCSTSSAVFFLFFSELSVTVWKRLKSGRIFVECHCTYTCALRGQMVESVSFLFPTSLSLDRNHGNWPGRLPLDMAFSFFLTKETRLKRHRSKLELRAKKKQRLEKGSFDYLLPPWSNDIHQLAPSATQPQSSCRNLTALVYE